MSVGRRSEAEPPGQKATGDERVDTNLADPFQRHARTKKATPSSNTKVVATTSNVASSPVIIPPPKWEATIPKMPIVLKRIDRKDKCPSA